MYIQMEVYIILVIHGIPIHAVSIYHICVNTVNYYSIIRLVLLNSNRQHDLKWKNITLFLY